MLQYINDLLSAIEKRDKEINRLKNLLDDNGINHEELKCLDVTGCVSVYDYDPEYIAGKLKKEIEELRSNYTKVLEKLVFYHRDY